MAKNPARIHPPQIFREAAKIANAIKESYAGKPMNRILLAQAMGKSPGSSDFRDKIMSAARFGLVNGNFNSETISLTPLGQRYTSPVSDDERLEAEREAIRKVPIFNLVLGYYNNNKLPETKFLTNALEREPFNVPTAWSQEVAEMVVANAKPAGMVRPIGEALYVILEAGPAPIQEKVLEEEDSESDENSTGQSVQLVASESELVPRAAPPTEPPPASSHAPSTRQFFIAHGKNRRPLDQLKKMLSELDIPYIVAEDEANVGRPISEKVADLMKACSAGIFLFTADEEFRDGDGNVVLRPRENVVYELGAAALLYGRRIVILKEQGVSFPTDFRDLGYIEFEKDNLHAKSMELLKELIGLKAVRILPGA